MTKQVKSNKSCIFFNITDTKADNVILNVKANVSALTHPLITKIKATFSHFNVKIIGKSAILPSSAKPQFSWAE